MSGFFFGLLGILLWFEAGYILAQFLQKKYTKLSWLANPNLTFGILFGWTIFGFFTLLDNSALWGCLITDKPVFNNENILWTGLELGLLCFGFLSKKYTRTIALSCELLIWIFKLYFW